MDLKELCKFLNEKYKTKEHVKCRICNSLIDTIKELGVYKFFCINTPFILKNGEYEKKHFYLTCNYVNDFSACYAFFTHKINEFEFSYVELFDLNKNTKKSFITFNYLNFDCGYDRMIEYYESDNVSKVKLDFCENYPFLVKESIEKIKTLALFY